MRKRSRYVVLLAITAVAAVACAINAGTTPESYCNGQANPVQCMTDYNECKQITSAGVLNCMQGKGYTDSTAANAD